MPIFPWMRRLASVLAALYCLSYFVAVIWIGCTHTAFYDSTTPFWALVGFVVWYLPLRYLRKKSWDGSPCMQEAQKTVNAFLGSRMRQPATTTARNAAAARLLFILALFFLLATVAGLWAIDTIGNRGAGRPLPVYTLDSLQEANPDDLPHYIRLNGTVAHPDLAWANHYHLRSGSGYIDYYMPRTAAGWVQDSPDASGYAPVSLIELDNAFADDSDDPFYRLDPPGPVEGRLSIETMPDWMADEMRAKGWHITANVFLLKREDLSGTVPGVDPMTLYFVGAWGGLMSFVFALAGLLARRRMKRQNVDS
ncbi:MAG: hypothetical protein KGI37_02600 [Alphaproteobacteria bacterium]|nr:hypothetical protein [Alphaproteobacteria bacterium]